MKTNLLLCLLLSTLGAHAQGTALTYQGRLNDAAGPASGKHDFQFTVRDALTDGNAVGVNPLAATLTVSNGLFTVTLYPGAGVFTGADRWLEIAVRPIGDPLFTTLSPRHKITATPYAITAGTVTGGVTASQVTGTIPLAQLPPALVTNGASGVNLTGTFSGNGAGLTGLNASQLTVGTVPVAALGNAWKTTGNAGTTPSTQFLGTTDNQPLEFKVNGQRGLRIEPTAGVPNVIGGSSLNTVGSGAQAATIAGGFANAIGTSSSFSAIGAGRENKIAANSDSATIAGGFGNNISNYSWRATIAGGVANRIGTNSHHGAIGGGWGNLIADNSENATIPGGYFNAIGTNSHSSAIGGGRENNIAANSLYATIPGGLLNTAVSHAFAAGTRAKANHTGAFVWADSQSADFGSTGINQFNIRAAGGVRLSGDTTLSFGSTLGQKISLFGTGAGTFGFGVQYDDTLGTGAAQYYRTGAGPGDRHIWYFGGSHNDFPGDGGGGARVMVLSLNGLYVYGTINELSDRNVKAGFEPVDPRTILEKVAALPITRWHFTNNVSTAHIGPMAQDFHAAFGLGTDDKLIATVDADGVALAAIQGLNQKLEDRSRKAEANIQKLETEVKSKAVRIAELERRLAAIETLLQK